MAASARKLAPKRKKSRKAPLLRRLQQFPEELLVRVGAGMGHGLPVPYYYMIDQQFFRELL